MRAVSVNMHESAIGLLCKTSKPGIELTVKGVPDDARLISCYHNPVYRSLYAIFEHESFEEVLEGCPYPSVNIEFTKHYREDHEI